MDWSLPCIGTYFKLQKILLPLYGCSSFVIKKKWLHLWRVKKAPLSLMPYILLPALELARHASLCWCRPVVLWDIEIAASTF